MSGDSHVYPEAVSSSSVGWISYCSTHAFEAATAYEHLWQVFRILIGFLTTGAGCVRVVSSVRIHIYIYIYICVCMFIDTYIQLFIHLLVYT